MSIIILEYNVMTTITNMSYANVNSQNPLNFAKKFQKVGSEQLFDLVHQEYQNKHLQNFITL